MTESAVRIASTPKEPPSAAPYATKAASTARTEAEFHSRAGIPNSELLWNNRILWELRHANLCGPFVKGFTPMGLSF